MKMNVYTYSETRQKLSHVLDSARKTGQVLIRRQDGAMFSLTPVASPQSPLDVKGLGSDVSTDEVVSFVRESRSRDS